MSIESLETLEEKDGKVVVPESRFKDANSARNLFNKFFEHDKEASANRARIQAMFDGEPPYSAKELRANNQSYRCNVNFGDGEDLLNDSLVPYIDMMQSVETLFHVDVDFGETAEERKRYSKEISKGLSDMIRSHPLYFQRHLTKLTQFIGQGVAFEMFYDHISWVSDVKGLGNFYVPRDSDASEEAVPVAFCVDPLDVSQLYSFIKDETAAEKMGWNVAAVKKAILNVATKSKNNTRDQSWETWVTKFKTDDMYTAATCDRVELLRCWVREFSGKVTYYILTRHAGVEEFLFEKKEVYDYMGQGWGSFTYGVGTSGKYYAIRSLGNRIYAPIGISNRMRCQHVDGSMLASSLLLRPKSESDLGKMLLTFRGPFSVAHPNAVVEPQQNNNFAQATLPVIRDMGDLIRAKASGYTSSKALPDDNREMSQYEASARIANAAGLTATNLVLYLHQEERVLREKVRRATAEGYAPGVEGGREVADLIEALEERGVPREAFYATKWKTLKITMPVGAGSAVARDNQYRRLRELAPAFDEMGQRRLLRDQTANILGSYVAAEEYVPSEDPNRLPDGAKVAILENFALEQGREVPVDSGEFHIAHLTEHTDYMIAIIQRVDSGEIATLAEAVMPLSSLHQHSVQHLQFLSQNPTTQADAARFRQVLQQSGEILLNGMRQLEAQQRDAAAQGEAQGQGPDPRQQEHLLKLQQRFEEHQLRMQLLQDEARVKTAIAVQEANTKARLADAKQAKAISPYAPQNVRPAP